MDFGTPIAGDESCIDTVRTLHQTIVALRNALERSRKEVSELKERSISEHAVEDTIRNLSVENHVLRQKIVSTEPLLKSKSSQKKVKRKGSKENLAQSKDDYNYKSINVTLENGLAKASKSLENVSKLQLSTNLSKSKTVCFSNTFEGERQISTSNSLHIPSLKGACVSNLTTGESQKLISLDKGVKSKRNLQFEEETVDDNVTVSRRGSITNFTSEGEIIAVKQSKDFKKRGKREEKSENVRPNKESSKSVLKREETFTKRNGNTASTFPKKSSVLEGDVEAQNKSKGKKKRGKSSILKNDNGEERIDNTELCDTLHSDLNKFTQEPLVTETTSDTALRKEKLKIINVELAQLRLKKDKNIELEDDGVETLVCSEIKENIAKVIEGIDETKDDTTKTIEDTGENSAETVGDIETRENRTETIEDIRQNSSETLENSETTENRAIIIADSAGTTGDNQINNKTEETEATSKEDESDIHKEENNSAEDNTVSNSGDIPLNSSDNSSNFSPNQKNVEISVKIYKGSKKPIEIDIQTKKKHRRRAKMSNKSQNTSFDKEQSTNETRRITETATSNNIVTNMLQNDIEQEVDDIELIFTTDDTKETDFKEELVPIDTYAETQLLQCPLSDYEEKLSADASDRELEDDVFNDNFENENQENCNFQSQTYDFRRENSQIYNSKSDNSINHDEKSLRSYYSYQDSSFENKSMEKDESFDRFEEKTRIIETDISKIGIQDVEYNMSRRNTCPNPIQYRPIMHREALGRGLNARKCRPILAHSNVVRKDSGAQTDISALPRSAWRSESSLGHKVKVGEHFTTLPSKFPHPGSRLRLSEKTVEARRVLLSDIGFTSMVPELSRSADHLCPPVMRAPTVSSYGQFLRTTDLYSPAYTSQKFAWSSTTPGETSHSQSRYSSQYPLSSPPVPTRRCSAPVSPSKKTAFTKTAPSRVRFANGSLPELRGDWAVTVDSGDSTDSLVEEAEHFLRRSIDCLAPCGKEICFKSENVKMSGVRRASAPEPARDNVPPHGWQPFLPRISRDLHLDYWVKVISPEGRVRGGRVRYVGPLMNQTEAFVGVQLSTPDGHSDGTYNNRRYFNCEPHHGIFVPFKKIIMGWRP